MSSPTPGLLRRLARKLPDPAQAALRRLRRGLFGPPPAPAPPPAPTAAGPPPNYLPNWPALLGPDLARWQAAVEAARNGPPVLIATSVGGHAPGAILESLLAVALTLRGARVHVLLCDQALPACLLAQVGHFPSPAEYAERGPSRLCAQCFGPAASMYGALGLPVHSFSDFLTPEDRQAARQTAAQIPFAEIGRFRWGDLAVGEHAQAGAVRFYARGNLEGEPQGDAILRRYLEAALLSAQVIRRFFDAHPVEAACFHHGIYVPQGLIGEEARRRGVRVINWNPAYRKRCFIFSHGDTYHHTMLDEPLAAWQNLPWTPEMEAAIVEYLESRAHGGRDWIWFSKDPQQQTSAIAAELGLDFARPIVTLLTNVFWDAQLFYGANAFPSMLDWVMETIGYFAGRPELQLIVRVHPGEVRTDHPSRQPLVAEIRKVFPVLPPNVFVVAPESDVSTYTLVDHSNAVLIYGTKTGVEVTSRGIPTIVAGESWIRNKGLTIDVSTAAEYFAALDRLPLPVGLEAEVTRRARQYAYHFFFRRMIPLGMFEPAGGYPPFRLRLSSLDELLPGRDPGLDLVCSGVLEGREFIYPAETLPGAPE